MTKTIFLIAGEASGDALGAKLMAALKAESSEPVTFLGVGGDRMKTEGITSIFPMEELSLLGFVEIIPHIPKLLGRITQVAEEINRVKPDLVVTIDAPAFNHRVARKLQGSGIKLVHYVAPTVWAYKPGRAAKIAKLYSHLLVILPFEPPYFEKEGLPTTFVGHPILEENLEHGDGTAFRKKHGIPANVPVLGIMPGSRSGELKRLLPVFGQTMAHLKKAMPYLQVVVFATPRFHERLRDATAAWPVPVTISADRAERRNALAACDTALAKSGTGTLEFALARIPMVVAYKVHPISAWMLRRMLQVSHVNLVNLVLKKSAIPELLQEDCTPDKLSAALLTLFRSDEARMAQTLSMHAALQKLASEPGLSPSRKAARVLLSLQY